MRLHIFAFAVTRTILNTMFRMVYPFLPVLSRGLGIEIETLSYVLTARSAAGVLGPLFASVADSRGRKAGVLFGLLLSTAGLVLVIVWPVFPVFAMAVILNAIGKFAFDPSMQAYLGDRVPYERRGRAIAATELSWSLSFILGVPLVGFLIARGGWTAPFPVFAILGLLSMVVIGWLLPPDPPVHLHRPSLLANLNSVLRSAPARAGLALAMLLTFANEVVNVVFGVWMEDAFGLQLAALGAASAIIGISELGGESLVVALSDRLGKERSVALGLSLNSLAALLLPVIGRSVPGALAGLFLFYLTFEVTLVSTLPMMTEILPSARATLMATNIASLSMGRALGALLSPQLYHWGFWANAASAVVLNLLALLALSYLWKLLKKPSPGG